MIPLKSACQKDRFGHDPLLYTGAIVRSDFEIWQRSVIIATAYAGRTIAGYDRRLLKYSVIMKLAYTTLPTDRIHRYEQNQERIKWLSSIGKSTFIGWLYFDDFAVPREPHWPTGHTRKVLETGTV